MGESVSPVIRCQCAKLCFQRICVFSYIAITKCIVPKTSQPPACFLLACYVSIPSCSWNLYFLFAHMLKLRYCEPEDFKIWGTANLHIFGLRTLPLLRRSPLVLTSVSSLIRFARQSYLEVKSCTDFCSAFSLNPVSLLCNGALVLLEIIVPASFPSF